MHKISLYLRARKTAIDVFLIAAILFAVILLFCELVRYSSGDVESFRDLPRTFAPYLFFDFHIWSANLRDCEIPIHLIALENSCSNHLYPFGYPVYPLYFLRLLPLTASSHTTLSLLLGSASIFCVLGYSIFQVVITQSIKAKLLMSITLIIALNTLPFRLLLERGQVDQVVLIAIAVICCIPLSSCSDKWREPVETLVYLLWALASLSKIFPIVGMVTYWALNAKFNYISTEKKSRLSHSKRTIPEAYLQCAQSGWLILQSSIVLITVVLLVPSYFDAASVYYPNIDSLGYGLNVLSNAAYANKSPTLTYAFKLIVLILSSAFGLIALLRSTSLSSINKDSFHLVIDEKSTSDQKMLFYVSICIVPAYLTTYSIAYKLSLLILILPSLSKMSASDSPALRTISSYVMVAYLLSCFFVNNPAYDTSLYMYKEWIVHFFLHPLFTGLLISSICYITLNSITHRRSITSSRRSQRAKP